MELNRRTFLRNTALASGALTLRGVTHGEQDSQKSASISNSNQEAIDSAVIRRQFQAPSKKFRPLVRWWWPGDGVDEAELRREIGVLDKAGLGGAEIQAFIKGFAANLFSAAQVHTMNGYATEAFFRHVGIAAEEAREHGMYIDYTFGSGWPFGGGEAITPELAAIELRWTHLSIAGPATFHEQLQIPSVTDGDPTGESNPLAGLPAGWAERMRKRAKVIAVVAVRGEDAEWDFHQRGGPRRAVLRPGRLEQGTSIDLTSHLQPDGTLKWDVPEGTWQLFTFCSVPTAQRINGAAGEGPQLVLDHLSAEAFAAHARRVGDAAIPIIGKFFGNGLRAVFCDSLEVQANLFWSDDFLTEFERRRGYDLVPYLPILKVQTSAQPFGAFIETPVFEMEKIGSQVRFDYRQTVSDLMIERFYSQFNQWAHKHNLLSRTQAHGALADVLRIYGEADIPETENLFGRGGYNFLKLASSAAHVYGRSIVGSESFVWPEALYQTTPEKMKVAADELLTAGVNAIAYHGFAYILPEVPAPGWHPFSGVNGSGNYSSQLNELNPFWPYLARLNAYLTRVQFVSQKGKNIAAVALYTNGLAHNAEEQPPMPRLNQAMLNSGYNYDHVNAESLLNCEVHDKSLVTKGGASYKVIVLPPTNAIDVDLAEKLANFAQAGLPILLAEQIPSQAQGWLENSRKSKRVQAAMRDMRNLPNVYAAHDADGAIAVLAGAVNPNIRFHGLPLPFMQKRIGTINAYFLRNPSDSLARLHAEFEAEGTPELWDPWTGETARITSHRRSGKWVEVQYDLEPLASALLIFDADASSHPAQTVPRALTLQRSEQIGAAGWRLAATGLVPSGQAATIRRELSLLIDWSLDPELRGFSARGSYTTHFKMPAADNRARFILDLGNVRDVAEVVVNGKPAGVLLLRPYRIDITNLVQPGDNILEITVTNSLFNSMVLRQPRAFRPGPVENPSGLTSSGLLGPVEIKIME